MRCHSFGCTCQLPVYPAEELRNRYIYTYEPADSAQEQQAHQWLKDVESTSCGFPCVHVVRICGDYLVSVCVQTCSCSNLTGFYAPLALIYCLPSLSQLCGASTDSLLWPARCESPPDFQGGRQQ